VKTNFITFFIFFVFSLSCLTLEALPNDKIDYSLKILSIDEIQKFFIQKPTIDETVEFLSAISGKKAYGEESEKSVQALDVALPLAFSAVDDATEFIKTASFPHADTEVMNDIVDKALGKYLPLFVKLKPTTEQIRSLYKIQSFHKSQTLTNNAELIWKDIAAKEGVAYLSQVPLSAIKGTGLFGAFELSVLEQQSNLLKIPTLNKLKLANIIATFFSSENITQKSLDIERGVELYSRAIVAIGNALSIAAEHDSNKLLDLIDEVHRSFPNYLKRYLNERLFFETIVQSLRFVEPLTETLEKRLLATIAKRPIVYTSALREGSYTKRFKRHFPFVSLNFFFDN